MAKTLTESRLTTRAARASLPEGVHWRAIDPEIHLGYRKGRTGGRWLVRWYAGNRRYQQATIGTADDAVSDGTLSFDAAGKVARDHVVKARRLATAMADGPIPTVRSSVQAYVATRDARDIAREGKPTRSDASRRLGRNVLSDPALADLALHALTEADLIAWGGRLNPSYKQTTRRRLMNDLKAALNAAYVKFRKRLPPDFAETVKHGLKCVASDEPTETGVRENQILSDDQVRTLIQTAVAYDEDGDLARLVITLAATGARFSQLKRLQVRDVQVQQSRLLVPVSRKGKGRVAGHIPVQVGSDVLAALQPAISGRAAGEPLLCRWRHIQTGPAKWERASRGPWQAPSDMIRPWHNICAEAGLAGTVPYALRHSSIVRGIRAGLPIRLVAASHDTSVAMIERHYSRWIADGLEELTARAVVPLVASQALAGNVQAPEVRRDRLAA